jgi:ATP-dependent Clp protease ATP-binding subunit ClpC
MQKKVMSDLERAFRPEFRNRLDSVIIFRALSREEIGQIVDLLLDRVRARLSEHDISLRVSESAKHFIAEEGYDPDFGARPLRRVIQHRIEDVLSEGILAGTYNAEDTVHVDVVEGQLVFKTTVSLDKQLEGMMPVLA